MSLWKQCSKCRRLNLRADSALSTCVDCSMTPAPVIRDTAVDRNFRMDVNAGYNSAVAPTVPISSMPSWGGSASGSAHAVGGVASTSYSNPSAYNFNGRVAESNTAGYFNGGGGVAMHSVSSSNNAANNFPSGETIHSTSSSNHAGYNYFGSVDQAMQSAAASRQSSSAVSTPSVHSFPDGADEATHSTVCSKCRRPVLGVMQHSMCEPCRIKHSRSSAPDQGEVDRRRAAAVVPLARQSTALNGFGIDGDMEKAWITFKETLPPGNSWTVNERVEEKFKAAYAEQMTSRVPLGGQSAAENGYGIGGDVEKAWDMFKKSIPAGISVAANYGLEGRFKEAYAELMASRASSEGQSTLQGGDEAYINTDKAHSDFSKGMPADNFQDANQEETGTQHKAVGAPSVEQNTVQDKDGVKVYAVQGEAGHGDVVMQNENGAKVDTVQQEDGPGVETGKMCTWCKNKIAAPPFKMCETCRAHHRARDKARRQKKKQDTRDSSEAARTTDDNDSLPIGPPHKKRKRQHKYVDGVDNTDGPHARDTFPGYTEYQTAGMLYEALRLEYASSLSNSKPLYFRGRYSILTVPTVNNADRVIIVARSLLKHAKLSFEEKPVKKFDSANSYCEVYRCNCASAMTWVRAKAAASAASSGNVDTPHADGQPAACRGLIWVGTIDDNSHHLGFAGQKIIIKVTHEQDRK